ncbi:MAG TPA: NgoMIV family type II restriction endonuclease [Anaerolineae bacterium]|nr:NgoMIV family type II restriction endonuclease [Anaerolineae bacterium]
MNLAALRKQYHTQLCEKIIRLSKEGGIEYPNFADRDNVSSRTIAWGIVRRMDYTANYQAISGQTVGKLFETLTKDFLAATLVFLQHLHPGQWYYSTEEPISAFAQYEHLTNFSRLVEQNNDLATVLGRDYIVQPDIVIGRRPVSDADINREQIFVSHEDGIAQLTPLRENNAEHAPYILHASISCKWTLRSDRGQNARLEALNLIRNRKGHTPHIAAVTAEPLPTRIASLALGTGDLDCVYHFALPELQAAIIETGNVDQMDMLTTLVDGKRLRDISDLPFDLIA